MRRTLAAVLVFAGMAVGFTAARVLGASGVSRMLPDVVIGAQASWERKSWAFYANVGWPDDERQNEDGPAAVVRKQ